MSKGGVTKKGEERKRGARWSPAELTALFETCLSNKPALTGSHSGASGGNTAKSEAWKKVVGKCRPFIATPLESIHPSLEL